MAATKPHVVVIGSSYVDIAIRCDDFPAPGQALTGNAFSCRPTGPGINQATQAAICGCDVHLISRVGDDLLGHAIKENLHSYKINSDMVFNSETRSTGAIVTMVNSFGENATCVSPGANSILKPADIESAQAVIASANVCLIHGELPQDTIVAAVRIARLHKVKVLLDPALGISGNTRNHAELPIDYFMVNILLPNIEEAAEIAEEPVTDIHKAKLVGSDLVARGAENAVIKMGRRGCLIVNRQGTEHVEPFEVEMVDKTCAGDAFAGALAASVAVGDTIENAVKFAAAAGALACTRFGCQESLPKKDEIIELLHRS